MELRNLVTFIHVAELGSFTKAAQQLGYSQSTVSFQIKQLEEELDCLLFERINHTVTLTERGREMIQYAHQVRALTEEFRENLASTREIRGNIHIVTPDSVCEDMIKNNYMEFYRKYPYISLKYTAADTTEMFRMLDHNEADAIITLDDHVYQKDYIIAKEKPFATHFVTKATSRFANAKNLSILDILQEPFILTERGQGYRKTFDKALAKRSLEIVPVLEIGRTDLITEVLTKQEMISFLPDFVTKEKVAAGELCYLDICDINVDIWKQLIYHKNKWMSTALKTFIEHVKEYEF